MWKSPGTPRALAEWESQVTEALLFLDLQRQRLEDGEATKAAAQAGPVHLAAPSCPFSLTWGLYKWELTDMLEKSKSEASRRTILLFCRIYFDNNE